MEETSPAKEQNKETKFRKWPKIVGWTVGAILLLLILLPLSLYIPWVQNVVKDYACSAASEATGLDISIERILIKFPLDVSVDGVKILDQQRDTMVLADNLTAGVAFMPLLRLQVEVDDAELTNGFYKMHAEDSSMHLRARLDYAKVSGIGVDLNHNAVIVRDGVLRGGDISLDFLPYLAKEKDDTTATEPWHVELGKVALEDIDYTMQMLPTIDRLTTHLARAELCKGVVDTGEQTVRMRSLKVDSVDCRYFYPDELAAKRYDAEHRPVSEVTDTVPSLPWTVTGDSIRLTNSSVIYAKSGITPRTDGMDMDYLQLSDVNVGIDSLFNCGMETRIDIKNLAAKERSGLEVRSGKGHIALNENSIDVKDLKITTMMSDLSLDAHLDNNFFEQGNKSGVASVVADSHIALQEVGLALPDMRPMLRDIPQYSPVAVKCRLGGTPDVMQIDEFVADLPRCARAQLSGSLANVMTPDRLGGNVGFDVDIANVDFVKPTLMDKAMRDQVNIPPMKLRGKAQFGNGSYSGSGNVKLATGELLADGRFNGNSEQYNVDATLNSFPLHRFMPRSTLGDITGHVAFSGRGLDFTKSSAAVNAKVDLKSIGYNNAVYKDIYADVVLSGGAASGTLRSYNRNCDLDVDFCGTISGDQYTFNAEGVVKDLNLKELRLYDGECYGRMNLAAHGVVNLKTMENDVVVDVNNLNWHLDGDNFYTNSAHATFLSTSDSVFFKLNNEETDLNFTAGCGLNPLIEDFQRSADIALKQIDKRALNIDTLRNALPKFEAHMTMGYDGLIPRYMRKYDVNFRNANLDIRNDSNIYINGLVNALQVGTTKIDTLTIQANELANKYLAFKAHMGNSPGTWDEFASVDVEGGIAGSTIDFLVSQRNIKNEQGYRLGMNATLDEDYVNVRLFPKQPIIGYRKWEVNDGNYLKVNYQNFDMNADLRLQSDSSVVAFTTVPHEGMDRDDLRLQVENLRIEEWLQMVPFAPEMSGGADADIKLTYDGKRIWGDGKVDLRDFRYERRKIGDVSLVSKLTFDPEKGSTNLDAELNLNGARVAFAYGALNDSTLATPMNLSLKMERFPLNKVSPFIPGRLVMLRGYLNGDISISGTMDKPVYSGYVEPDSAKIYLPRYGSQLGLSATRIPMDNGVIKFNNFGIIGINDNQVKVNGEVDIHDLNNMVIDLSLAGKNVQFVGSDQRHISEVFGKGFVDLSAIVKSRGGNMRVNADAKLLSSSNITYVLKEDVSTITNSSNRDMVTFVNMTDTASVDAEQEPTSNFAMDILANINIEQGAKINAFLSEDGNDRLNIVGNGALKYTMDFAGKAKLVGKLIVESGNVRYSPPLISMVNFEFDPGSYIEWTGDIMNPQLHINATEKLKTSVSNNDSGSRLVDFLVKLKVGNTLSNMDLNFDLEASNDAAVANDLQTMTAQQRSTAAMNLLLYGSYKGVNASSSNGFSTTGALYSFLQSQLNSWAAKSLKGVDLTFGINQYEAGTNGRSKTETSYSYRLAKTLFNDRFKIVIGGEYSTDATSEENFSQNLINDISFEYYLNAAGSKYVHLFRHTGYESVLEGQITTMGVGFVMKRKLNRLWDIFKKKPKAIVVVDTNDVQEEPLQVELQTDSVEIVKQD